MAGSLLSVGITGLQAAQLGLSTTSHNIANVGTPGFNRQQIVQTTQNPLLSGAGFIGQGTSVDTVRRLYGDFLNRQVTLGETQSAALETLSAQLRQINDFFADPNSGLSSVLQEFFAGVQNLANEPSTVVARQALLGAAESLVSRFHLLDQRLAELRGSLNQQVASTVLEINAFTQQIAQLNQRIALAEINPLQQANDLRDQRDQLVTELNRLIGATVVEQGNSYSVFIGNGVPVVIGDRSFTIGVTNSPTDPGRTVVGVVTAGGTVQIQESSLQGGSLGGLLLFRSQNLDSVQNALGRIAIVLGGTFNDQHVLGQDLTGALGGDFFNLALPAVTASSGNTGNAQLSAVISDYSALATSDYLVSYDGANYVVTRLTDNVQQTFAALPATIGGVTLALDSGVPAAGDIFLLRPVANGASSISVQIKDPALIAAAAPIRTAQGTANTGTGIISAGSVNTPPPPDPNLQQAVTITFSSPPNTFDVSGIGTGDPVGIAYTSGSTITYNGWTITISGNPAAGDTFTVSANSSGISDNRNALLLGALQTQATMSGGTATYQASYAQMVSEIGNGTRQAQIRASAQDAFLVQARQAQQSFSGVNLDEEAANLVRYQQAYQASARVIQIGSRLFDDLLDILR